MIINVRHNVRGAFNMHALADTYISGLKYSRTQNVTRKLRAVHALMNLLNVSSLTVDILEIRFESQFSTESGILVKSSYPAFL